MSLYGLFKGTGPSGFGWNSTADEVVDALDLGGQHILITGCNSGVGFETMRVLAASGATVLGAARTRQKADEAAQRVAGTVIPVVCELEEPESVRACVDEVGDAGAPLDAIICNAGIMALPDRQTVDGYEKQFYVNHVGHFMLVTGLLDQLTGAGRVVMLSSEGHRAAPKAGIEFDNLSAKRGYGSWRAYGQSKLANILFATELARRFEDGDTDRVANAVHPGVISTNLTRHMNVLIRGAWKLMGPLVLKTPAQGAATETWAAVHPDAAGVNGEYLDDCNVADASDKAGDAELAKRLWAETERIVDEVSPDYL